MNSLPLNVFACISEHSASKRTALSRIPIGLNGEKEFDAAGARWKFSLSSQTNPTGAATLTFAAEVIKGNATQVAVGIEWEDPNWSTENYVLYPGSVYNGNRFHAERYAYSPPPIGPSLADEDQTIYVNDVPRLEQNGAARLELLSNDCTTPGIGIHFPHQQKGLLILTDAKNALGPYGYEIEENETQSTASIRLMSPGILHEMRHGLSGYTCESEDRGVDLSEGSKIEIACDWHEFECRNTQGLFDKLFAHREDCFDLPALKNEIPFSAVWDILHEKHNATNWIEQYGLYQTSISNDPTPPFNLFQTGWCGGGITTLPMIQSGDERSIERSLRNLELLFRGQTEFGLFQEYFDGMAWFGIHGKTYCAPPQPWTMTRRIGDALYFIIRQLMALDDRCMSELIQPGWIDGIYKNLEAIRTIWKENGTIGQYVNVHTGKVEVSASTCGALIPAGLVLAAEYFKESEWIELAEEIAEDYRTKDLATGITSGGPGDCIQAPDSESVAALVESFALLYDTTKKEQWLQAAKDATVQLGSWAFSYDAEFPEGTALAEIGAQSRGAFMANVQNRCGVPGLCTLSGEGMLRAFRATGDWSLLELLRDVTHTIPQYMGRKDKLIPTRGSWGRKGLTHQPPGWICERVNVGRWGDEMIGEITAYSCWCETTMMLIWNDLPGVYCDVETHKVICIDHVSAIVEKHADGVMLLSVTNPTKFDSKVKILAETATSRQSALPTNAGSRYNQVLVPAGETISIPIDSISGPN